METNDGPSAGEEILMELDEYDLDLIGTDV